MPAPGVKAISATSTTSAGMALAPPSGIAVGDVIVALGWSPGHAVDFNSVADKWTPGPAVGRGTPGDAGAARLQTAWLRCASTDSGLYWLNLDGLPATRTAITLLLIEGCVAEGDVIDAAATANVDPGSRNAEAPGLTTVTADTLILAAHANGVQAPWNPYTAASNAGLSGLTRRVNLDNMSWTSGATRYGGYGAWTGARAAAGAAPATSLTLGNPWDSGDPEYDRAYVALSLALRSVAPSPPAARPRAQAFVIA